MVQVVKVEGHEAFKAAAKEHEGKTIFALFCGSKDANGESWCPDCVVGVYDYLVYFFVLFPEIVPFSTHRCRSGQPHSLRSE